MLAMRKRYRVLFFAALVAALIVPVGYALSIDSKPKAARTRYIAVVPAAAVVAAPVMMPRVGGALSGSVKDTLSDSAKLLCIGTVLFGLAAAVRKVN
jgi:MFS family permease